MKTENKIAVVVVAVAVGSLAVWLWSIGEQSKRASERTAELKISTEAARARIEAFQKGETYLANCLVCKKQVSSAALKCPHCGDPR
jgi:hypothetical protein